MVTGRPAKDRWDVIVVGASLAGCSTAIGLAQAGARVALLEKRPDPDAFKRICGHFVQPSAIPALERLRLMDRLAAAGALRSGLRVWARWGWIEASEDGPPPGLNLRREVMDPVVREAAAATPGVELMLGRAVDGLIVEDGEVRGVDASRGERSEALRGRLVVGADGRSSKVASLAGLPRREAEHGRFVYAVYVDGGRHDQAGADARIWMRDPDWAATFPTDEGLTLYSCMPTMDKLASFKRDVAGSIMASMRTLPDAPPVDRARVVGPALGKVSMPNVKRGPIAPGLALVGDAALATDPLWGVGCGWAFEGGVRLADALAPAVLGAEPLGRGLARYRRAHRRALALHSWLIDDYATGRRFSAVERFLFAAAAHDARVADRFHEFGTRRIQLPAVLPVLPRGVAVNARRALGRRRGYRMEISALSPTTKR